MWTVEGLIKHASETQTEINGKWVAARPLNGKKEYMPLLRRIKDAWAVFTCKAEAFKWYKQ